MFDFYHFRHDLPAGIAGRYHLKQANNLKNDPPCFGFVFTQLLYRSVGKQPYVTPTWIKNRGRLRFRKSHIRIQPEDRLCWLHIYLSYSPLKRILRLWLRRKVLEISDKALMFERFPGFTYLSLWWMGKEHWWKDTDRENRSTRRKTSLSTTMPTTNPTLPDLGSNAGLRGEKPATNHLSHCIAKQEKWWE